MPLVAQAKASSCIRVHPCNAVQYMSRHDKRLGGIKMAGAAPVARLGPGRLWMLACLDSGPLDKTNSEVIDKAQGT